MADFRFVVVRAFGPHQTGDVLSAEDAETLGPEREDYMRRVPVPPPAAETHEQER